MEGQVAHRPREEVGGAREGARPPTVEHVLRRSETEEVMERLEKRKKLLALTKDVRQEQQAMAIAEAQPGAGKLTEVGSFALLCLAYPCYRCVA